ncbi:hypothetical protein [Streptomyces sp. ITFR-16]|uniref:hypothetical protein n=1 Tax=Streptomyces sp. ITFR-16 TaxID=3075198 RepID=UPI00288A08D9|nr:hypothetical protein [Streptomyces sp. ITFR-16]WNI24498.1 hypothetical protein RLT58_22510 [Streptomyces sp. ITFR-16]
METWREGARAGHTHEPNEVTIQLDGLGRQLSELLPEPGAPEGSDGPVFVDESGRRSKTLRRLGWVLAAVFVCYAVTLVVAVLGGNSSAPFLPLSGQEEHKKAEEVQTPQSPGASPDAQVSPGATADPSASASESGGSTAEPGSSTGAGSSATPGTGSTASAPVAPPKKDAGTAGTGGGSTPAGESTAPVPPVDPGTPTVDPEPTPPETTPTPAESAEPPVQDQEGAH